VLFAGLCLAAVALSAGGHPAVAGARSAQASGCGAVNVSYPAGKVGGGSDVRIVAVTHIGCPAARRVTARCIRDYKVPGWSAFVSRSNLQAMRLTNGRMVIRLVGIAGGAPRCTAAAYNKQATPHGRRAGRAQQSLSDG
jgi:hypothetical protein